MVRDQLKQREDARQVVEEFLQAFEDPEEYFLREVEFVERMRNADMGRLLPSFYEALRRLKGRARLMAAMCLVYMGRARPDAVEDLVALEAAEALADAIVKGTVDLQRFAAALVCYSGLVPASSMKALVKHLRDDDVPLRTASAGALISAGKVSANAVEILGQALSSEETALIAMAAAALPRLKVRQQQTVAKLQSVLTRENPTAQRLAVVSLGLMGNAACDATPKLIAMLASKDVNVGVRSSIAYYLGEIGEGGDEAERALLEALKADEWEIVSSAAVALKKPGDAVPRQAVKTLCKRLGTENRDIRAAAARALCEFGAQIKTAVPALVERVVKEADDAVLEIVVEALGVAGRTAIPVLLTALRVSDVRTRQPIGIALLRIGKSAAAELAQAMLTYEDPIVRETLSSLLYLMGPQAEAAAPVLISALETGDAAARHHAIVVLSAIGPEGRVATAALIAAIDSANEESLPWIEKALVGIGPEVLPLVTAHQERAKPSAKNLLTRVIGRLGQGSVPSTETRLSKLRDDKLLEFFAIIANIIDTKGPQTNRELAKRLSEMKTSGTLPKGVYTSDAYVWKALVKLEQMVGKTEGKKTVPLIARRVNRQKKGGLTKAGRELFEEVSKYLAAKRRVSAP